MPKEDMKLPFFSKKLAEDFERISNEKGRVATLNIGEYTPIENYGFKNIMTCKKH